MSSTRVVRWGISVLGALAMVTLLSSTASAQVAVTGGLDVANQYNFRGIRQNIDGVSIWPYFDIGVPAYKGDGGLKSVSVNFGMWNALHSELDDNKWYEADYYAVLGLGFGGGVSLGTTYTSYTSPADLWAHIKEVAFKLAVDDSAALGKGALKPYAVVAFELTDDGQADAGAGKGTYIELGVAPGYAGSKASLAVPIKIGLSGKDYYEFGTGTDDKFGYFSIAGVVTVPMGAHANIHGGVEFQKFGDNLKSYNGFGDDHDSASTGIMSVGVGFAF
jgi:hypothetical protein